MEQKPTRVPSGHIQLPPGFRFYPTDEELVVHYLCKKAASQPFAVPIIAEIELYKFDPWDLPEKALFGEKEWYFFSPRDRKYPNGSRPNRAAGSGYWKATGTDKPINTLRGSKKVGVKKALVFYQGKAPKGIKTNWIMHEYRLADSGSRSEIKKKGSLLLDAWVLCRIYNKAYKAAKERLSSDLEISSEEHQDEQSGPLLEDDEKGVSDTEMIPDYLPSGTLFSGNDEQNYGQSLQPSGSSYLVLAPPLINHQESINHSRFDSVEGHVESTYMRPLGFPLSDSFCDFAFDGLSSPIGQLEALSHYEDSEFFARLAAMTQGV